VSPLKEHTNMEDSTKQPVTIPSTIYDKLKSFVQVVGPALITFYLFAGHAYGWSNVEVNAGVATSFLVAVGVAVTWLSANFKKSDARFDGVIEVTEDPNTGLKNASLILKNYENPADVVNQKEATFKVTGQ
jgi:Putative phage holin Dp-1